MEGRCLPFLRALRITYTIFYLFYFFYYYFFFLGGGVLVVTMVSWPPKNPVLIITRPLHWVERLPFVGLVWSERLPELK